MLSFFQPDKKPLSFPPWVLAFTHLSHLLVTFACSANFYIYFAKYGSRSIFKRNQNERISQRNPTCINRSEGDRTRSQYQNSRLEVEHNGATSTTITTLFKNKSMNCANSNLKYIFRVLRKLLVEVGGANISIKDSNGQTPAELCQSYVKNYLLSL